MGVDDDTYAGSLYSLPKLPTRIPCNKKREENTRCKMGYIRGIPRQTDPLWTFWFVLVKTDASSYLTFLGHLRRTYRDFKYLYDGGHL